MKQKAFTLVELLVVLSIIVIMTAVIIVNYRPGERTINLQREGVKLSQNVRKVQAMLGSNWEACSGQENYEYSYGLFLDVEQEQYIIFADCDGNKEYNEEQDGIVEIIELEKDIEIASIKYGEEETNILSIVFVLPDPTVYFSPSADYADITFQTNNGNNSVTIRINKIGLVEFLSEDQADSGFPFIIFGEEKLYIHPEDNSTEIEWGCFGIVKNADSNIDGLYNTNQASGCTVPDICSNLVDTYEGYSDWFLPAIDQLDKIYDQWNNNSINKGNYETEWVDFAFSAYLSSTESSDGPESVVWGILFLYGSGARLNLGKNANVYMARCVRSD
ncbi:MAG: type II secretion system protein [Candidatus Pacebacteria bacterium]|nr:type II secretion system protein [Candidatus Paceibacterota bacterium]